MGATPQSKKTVAYNLSYVNFQQDAACVRQYA